MTICLGMTCACGRSIRAPCPTVDEITSIDFAGWGHDDHGFARCQRCLNAGETVLRMIDRKDARQAELFAEAAA